MSLVLVRIDDRLIHGQVVEGWLPVLKVERILVVSDQAAGDATQEALMRLALPEGIGLEVCPRAAAAAAVLKAESSPEAVLVLAPGPGEVLALLESGLKLESVNVGGLHYAAGRVQLGKAIFLSREDRGALEAIAEKGVRLEGRAVPLDHPTDVLALIKART